MRIVVVTGLGGSGKSTVLRALEDAGFYAIDNLPIVLLDKVIDLGSAGAGGLRSLALVVDARDPSSIRLLPDALEAARRSGHEVELWYLDARDRALEQRYSETRRRHPLAPDSTVKEGIAKERALLDDLRTHASLILDTSTFSAHDLKREVHRQLGHQHAPVLGVNLVSFGFRHGLPGEADVVLDVRFLPNPYFVEHLRPLTGLDPSCADYVLSQPEAKELLRHLEPLVAFLLPQFHNEGKSYVTIAIGCTGGQHRSVAITAALASKIRDLGYSARVTHRDLKSPDAG